MSWTHRVRKKAINAAEIEYGIIEYYTTADSDGWTECWMAPMAPISIVAPDDPLSDAKALDELRWQLTEMLKALDKPIVEED
jgi:hypothetical protein